MSAVPGPEAETGVGNGIATGKQTLLTRRPVVSAVPGHASETGVGDATGKQAAHRPGRWPGVLDQMPQALWPDTNFCRGQTSGLFVNMIMTRGVHCAVCCATSLTHRAHH